MYFHKMPISKHFELDGYFPANKCPRLEIKFHDCSSFLPFRFPLSDDAFNYEEYCKDELEKKKREGTYRVFPRVDRKAMQVRFTLIIMRALVSRNRLSILNYMNILYCYCLLQLYPVLTDPSPTQSITDVNLWFFQVNFFYFLYRQ